MTARMFPLPWIRRALAGSSPAHESRIFGNEHVVDCRLQIFSSQVRK
jgi:hypothetical protein